MVAALLLWQRPWQSTTSDDVVPVPRDASTVLDDQFRALNDARSLDDFVAAAGSSAAARTFATHAWQARDALDVTDVELRYLRGGEVSDRGDGSTNAEVAVSWRTGADSAISGTSVKDSTVDVRVDPQPDGTFAIRSVSATGHPVPLWLAGRVAVEQSADVDVVTVDGGVPDVDITAMAKVARSGVRTVVPGVDRPLTVVSPRTRATTAALAGRPEAEVEPIAAITTTVDGGPSSARIVLLNPDQFASMDARAAQVVVTHEATHLLTEAVGTEAESWVSEGFADFVALHDDTAPLSLSAGQILRQVSDDGAPTALPTAGDFGRGGRPSQVGDAPSLGAVYESAWMAFRMLGERFDDRTILRFYRDVLSGTSTDEAARRWFDLSVGQITAQWRDYLTKSASTVS